MILKKRLMVCTAAVALTGATALPATAAPWVRGYVVGAYEYAFRYDGRADFTGDCAVTALDFNFMKNNFGLAGSPPLVGGSGKR